MSEAHTCNHPLVPHTVWYWLNGQKSEDGPVTRGFETLEAADIFAQKILRQNPKRLAWLKIFRSDNESYTCFRWDNPKKELSVEEQKVKLEVDMEPLKLAFDNVATGFAEQGKSIRRLWLSQVVLAGSFLTTILVVALR